MLHALLWALLAIVVAGGLCALAAVFLPAGEQIAPPLRDEPLWTLPRDRDLHAEDVDTVRLPVALRGYRFAETDLLLDRLADEIRVRDVELARLRGTGPVPVAGPSDLGPVGDESSAPAESAADGKDTGVGTDAGDGDGDGANGAAGADEQLYAPPRPGAGGGDDRR